MNEWVSVKGSIEVVPQEFHRLTGGQRDPRDKGVTSGMSAGH